MAIYRYTLHKEFPEIAEIFYLYLNQPSNLCYDFGKVIKNYMINANEAGAKYTKKSFMAFLNEEPTCDEKWVAGVINASTPQDITQALESLSVYSNKKRFQFLKQLCGQLN